MIKFFRAVSIAISAATFTLAGCGSDSTLVDMDAPPSQAKPSIEAVPAAALEADKSSAHPNNEAVAIPAPTI